MRLVVTAATLAIVGTVLTSPVTGQQPASNAQVPAKLAPAKTTPPITAPAGKAANAGADPAPPKTAEKSAGKGASTAATVPVIEAKTIFGALGTPAPLPPRVIGFYSHGCLAGAEPMPIDGPLWQVMRLSRNRNWGHPDLVRLLQRLAGDAKSQDGWPGLLVGDMSQPRGGPMLTGHASHQVGLDADIWLTPMPDHRLSAQEREDLAATSMLGADDIQVDPAVWTPAHAKLIVRAASYPEVERMFVHPGIKKALCLEPGIDRANLRKIQPYYGHYYHMHIRIACPKGSDNCKPQIARPADDGCGKEVDQWVANFRRSAAISAARPKVVPDPNAPAVKRAPAKPGLLLAQLPSECRMVIDAGAPGTLAEAIAKAKSAATATASAPSSGE